MSILRIEIEGHGEFDIKADMTHRSRNYLKTFDEGRFKEVQFDSCVADGEAYLKRNPFQKGYDYNGDEIKIKGIRNAKITSIFQSRIFLKIELKVFTR